MPIDGRLDKFAGELTKSGFIISDSTKKNEIILNADFLNKKCKIHVLGTHKNNLAYKVIVDLPAEVPDSLQSGFEKLQKLYSSKYGNGKTRYQQYRNAERFLFNEPKRIRHLSKGDFTMYKTDSGNITMEVMDGYISISYSDKLNNEIREREMEGEE